MKEIRFVVEEKNASKKYEEVYTCTNEAEVYKQLTSDLIAKKINCCTYITSIKRVNNYDGTQNITVNYSNNVRRIYTVKN